MSDAIFNAIKLGSDLSKLSSTMYDLWSWHPYYKVIQYTSEESPDIITIAEHMCDFASVADKLHHELHHLVRLLEPVEKDGGLDVPGLATLNGARAALAAYDRLKEIPEND